jgi:flagellar biosynthetic protein FliR
VSWLQHLDTHLLLVFTLVLTRTSGLVMTMPVFGSQELPVQVRSLLAVAMAMLVTPTQLAAEVPDPENTVKYVTLMGGELAIGLTLGLGVFILFSGIQLSGVLIGRTSGLALADVYDPSLDESLPQFGRLLFLVVAAVFLLIGGHRMVITGLLDTFRALPPGGATMPTKAGDAVVLLVSMSFSLGIRAAAPVVTVGTVVLGLVSRTLPQLNIIALGFGLNALITFGVLAATLGAGVWAFQEQVEPTVAIMIEALTGK